MLSNRFRFLPVLVLATVSAGLHAQSFAAAGTTASTPSTPKVKASDLPPIHTMEARIQDGVLTVDGLVAKVHLNYDIKDADFLYLYLPGHGTAIVSLSRFPNAIEQKDSVRGSTLRINGNGHVFELTTQGKEFGEDFKHDSLWVRFDVGASALGRYPMVGYGNSLAAPYVWPGAERESHAQANNGNNFVAPPVPVNLLPRYASSGPANK